MVAIRDGVVGEVGELIELQRRSSLEHEDYREQLLAHPDAIDLPVEHLSRGFVRVATTGGRAVGFATVVVGADGVGELDGLFVEPDQWRRGIGRALIDDAVAIARARGDTRLEVTANPTALEFYEALGFVTDGDAPTRFGPALRMHLAL